MWQRGETRPLVVIAMSSRVALVATSYGLAGFFQQSGAAGRLEDSSLGPAGQKRQKRQKRKGRAKDVVDAG